MHQQPRTLTTTSTPHFSRFTTTAEKEDDKTFPSPSSPLTFPSPPFCAPLAHAPATETAPSWPFGALRPRSRPLLHPQDVRTPCSLSLSLPPLPNLGPPPTHPIQPRTLLVPTPAAPAAFWTASGARHPLPPLPPPPPCLGTRTSKSTARPASSGEIRPRRPQQPTLAAGVYAGRCRARTTSTSTGEAPIIYAPPTPTPRRRRGA